MCYRHGGSALVSHLSFADDMIIFANGQKQSIRRILDYLEHYEGVSGQLIRRLEILTGFRHQQQPFTYLGVPLFKGTKRSFLYDDLIQKIRNRISGWASRLLLPGGRITLLRSVLSSIPLHLLQIMQPPKRSLWAQFLLGKYCKGTHPLLAAVPSSASPTWKRLKSVGLRTDPHIAWHLGTGQIFFWHDCWMGESTLASLFSHRQHTSARVQDFFDDTGWDFGRLLQALPSHMAE
ncbi:uncharacterized protein LOC111373332 [Olea europaea var. sylvestris]|uniref:uncharacterized protein LOC111373332 n=1 Tax=Olea europaea var. sylvestris TaxID=158386 RepID=UPI000C1D109B|nr:uncharacterized protein LOC111373332 [Olea europaea var. sylvestris]